MQKDSISDFSAHDLCGKNRSKWELALELREFKVKMTHALATEVTEESVCLP